MHWTMHRNSFVLHQGFFQDFWLEAVNLNNAPRTWNMCPNTWKMCPKFEKCVQNLKNVQQLEKSVQHLEKCVPKLPTNSIMKVAISWSKDFIPLNGIQTSSHLSWYISSRLWSTLTAHFLYSLTCWFSCALELNSYIPTVIHPTTLTALFSFFSFLILIGESSLAD